MILQKQIVQSITFFGHPADILTTVYNEQGMKTYIKIDKTEMVVDAIKYIGAHKYKVLCKFPTDKITRENLIKTLNKLLDNKEIAEYTLQAI